MLMMPTFRGDGSALPLAKFHLITPMMINISINEVKLLVRLIIECKQWHGIIFKHTIKTNQAFLRPSTNFEAGGGGRA